MEAQVPLRVRVIKQVRSRECLVQIAKVAIGVTAANLALGACSQRLDPSPAFEPMGSGGELASGGGGAASGGAASGGAASGGAASGAGGASSGGDAASGGAPMDGTGASGSGGGAAFKECKRGIAMTDLNAQELELFVGSSGWFYDWGLVPPQAPSEEDANWGMEFVPMVWTGTPDFAEAVAAVPADAKYLLGFNEPNFKSQANLTVEQAVSMWPALEAIAEARDLKLVSPAVNFCGPESECWGTDPFEYLDDFLEACVDCRVDYVAIHGYFDNVAGLSWYLGEAKSRYDLPIWLTEFNRSPGDAAAQLEFMKQAIPLLEADPMVFRYAWFMARSTVTQINLLTSDGNLTDLGVAYTTLPGDCITSAP